LTSPRGIDLSSNDYLGLAQDSRLKDAMIEAVEREGVGSTGSRLLRGERDCFREVEEKFAAWKGTERSLYFATGYQANIGIMQAFLEKDDIVFSDEQNHASLIDGIRLAKCKKHIYSHLAVDTLEDTLSNTETRGQKFLVTESLFSMDGDIAPLKTYAGICSRTNTNLIVDEAHAVGIYGKTGSGLIEEFGIEDNVFLSINTAGKALGVSGAFAAGSDLAIDYLINKCRSFVFSTAPIPAVADTLKVAIEIIENEKERREDLRALCRTFSGLLRENGFAVPKKETQIVPIIIGDSSRAVAIAEKMQAFGFDVRAIRPPTVAEGTSRLRVTLNLGLDREILTEFVEKLKQEVIEAQNGELAIGAD
ncbi:MAG: 8-amino-7-oxononanoate synthase, partial [Pyrinomonadaceae bacterium]|nr:8-amino-7-oxononanoate synthase [Pyrinomonadaceae bacterium]